jgi:hypothetical protein
MNVKALVFFMCGVLLAASGLPPSYLPEQLTKVHQHIASCVRTAALRHFSAGRPVSVSMPSNELPATNATPSEDIQHMVHLVLRELNDMMRWPILFYTSDTMVEETQEVVLPHSYIIFLWPQQDKDVNDTIKTQMENQKDSLSWNPLAKFLVVVTGLGSEPHISVARRIFVAVWEMTRISNIVLMIPNSSEISTLDHKPHADTEETKTIDLYSFFPYKSGNCGKLTDITIIDKWLLENIGNFERNTNLFPPKIPKDFMGCPIIISSIGFEPFVIAESNHTQEDGSITYNVRGAFVEYFLIALERMNVTVIFLRPELDPTPDAFISILTDQIDWLSDITIGFVPVFPVVAIPGIIYTVPHSSAVFSLFVPCPSRTYKMSKLFSIFTLPVWLTLALAFLLTCATFWCFENESRRFKARESRTATSISLPVYNAWAILMAVSVPKMPNTWTYRLIFLLYVSYSFAMVTVFQTFFVSHLVEPGYGKKMTVAEEAISSDLIYAYHPLVDFFLTALDYNRYNVGLPDSRKLLCVDTIACTKRLINQRDIAFINAYFYIKYIASATGISDYNKVICHIDESFSLYAAGLLHKASPFLSGINRIMRRCIESGIFEMIWDHELLRAHLQSMGSNDEFQDTSGSFFVFQVHHLTAPFVILLLGHAISCTVFVLELIHKRISAHRCKPHEVLSVNHKLHDVRSVNHKLHHVRFVNHRLHHVSSINHTYI